MTSMLSNKHIIEPNLDVSDKISHLPSKQIENIGAKNLAAVNAITSLDLMLHRAKTAESALKISNEALSSLENIQKNSLEIIRETKEVVLSMQTKIKEKDESAAKNELALKELMSIVDKNRANIERSAVDYDAIHEIAFFDPLTKLPNRRMLDDRLNQIILNNKRWNSYSAAIFIDLDKFKEINDTHGHNAGDALLIAFGERIKGCIRETDTVARYGGDEFVVLLDRFDGNLKEATKLAQMIANKLLTTLTPIYTLNVHEEKEIMKSIECECFASLGVAMFNGVITDKTYIIDRADKAMYSAKYAGGKRIQFAE